MLDGFIPASSPLPSVATKAPAEPVHQTVSIPSVAPMGKTEETQRRGKVTISIGIASFPEHATTGEGAIEKADRALYRSKESGRNRTTIYSPQPDEDLIEG